MNKQFEPLITEPEIYKFWESSNLLKSPLKGKHFTILMPPPNANASLHAGHGMYTIDDIMIRFKRLTGFASLWIPGMDHAGFETQFVYEKHLKKDGKSRLDFDRQTLYNNILKFVRENSGLIFAQFKQMGFLADWDKSIFTLNDQVIDYVYETFEKMVKDGHVYRDEYIVNYCTSCGTSLADLEVEYQERTDPLYYIKYGPFVLATVRPETKFGDTAVAVNPKDRRYSKWVGKEIEINGLLGKFNLKVIADNFVDPEFGTGVVKVTPGHDANDFQMGRRHNLAVKKVIDMRGKLTNVAGPYAGLNVNKAREKVVADLTEKGLIDHVDAKYIHSVQTCYKCHRVLEPLTVPNWFIKVEKLKKRVIDVVKKDEIKFYPGKFKKQMLDWLDVMHDWPISRQIVWGIRIPIWYKVEEDANNIYVSWIDKTGRLHHGPVDEFIAQGVKLNEIKDGLQSLSAHTGEKSPEYVISKISPGDNYLPETDTFDTWFSSGQWPLVTLKGDEFKTRFPTDFMGTLADILKFWVSRMIMFSLYRKNEVPFRDVYLWSLVADAKGQKMSKSLGNVINPIVFVEKYGADAFRGALLFGVAQGGKVALSEDRVRAMRNYANKVWNIGRFVLMNKASKKQQITNNKQQENGHILTELEKEFKILKRKYLKDMESFKFSRAFDDLYEFIWHRLADYYIESLKVSIQNGEEQTLSRLESVFLSCVQMLHPFMPFVTEAIWQEFDSGKKSILLSRFNCD